MSKPDSAPGHSEPTSASDVKRQLEAGECFLWEGYGREFYFSFAETVGPIRTEVGPGDDQLFTGPARDEHIRAALRFGGLERIDHDEIPNGESQ